MITTDIRRQNFIYLFDRFKEAQLQARSDLPASGHGMLRLFAEALDESEAYVSHIKNGHRNVGNVKARKFEEKLNLPEGWMDVPHGPGEKAHSAEEQAFLAAAAKLYREDPRFAQTTLMTALASKLRRSGK